MKTIIIILILLSPSAALADRLPEILAVNLVLIADWSQTRDIARSPHYAETNAVLDEHPEIGSVDKYFGAVLVVYNLAAFLLPEKQEKQLTRGLGLFEIMIVGHNAAIGIGFDF